MKDELMIISDYNMPLLSNGKCRPSYYATFNGERMTVEEACAKAFANPENKIVLPPEFEHLRPKP